MQPITANNDTVYLERMKFEGDPTIVDSAVVADNEVIKWKLPLGEQQMYRVRSKTFIKNNFIFVVDGSGIVVNANFIGGSYTVVGSQATDLLLKFNSDRIKLVDKARKITSQKDSLVKLNASKARIDSADARFNAAMADYFNYGIPFADTVSSPAVFLSAFYTIDFGPDHQKLKTFITRAARRFPDHKGVQDLAKLELATVKIYEEEYQVGDVLPDITLPDQNGFPAGTSSYKGKYYLMDLWSSWCPQCLPFKEAERSLLKKLPAGTINILSVAIDNQKSDWQTLIKKNKYEWPQLIDEGAWQGIAVKTLKFDSIPFNFLVDPKGRIIAKAIRPDSLEAVVLKHIKQK